MSYRLTYIAQHLKATATNACGRLLRVDDGTGLQIPILKRVGLQIRHDGNYHQTYTDFNTGKTTDYYFSTKDAILKVRKSL